MREFPGNLVKWLESWTLTAGGDDEESIADQVDDLHPSGMARQHTSTTVFLGVVRD